MRVFVLAATILATSASCAAETSLVSAYSLGAGAGITSMRGDLLKSSNQAAIGGGIDFHSESIFFLARGYTATDNSGSGMDIAVGAGNRWIKGGLAYSLSSASLPTQAGPVAVASGPLAGIVSADITRESQVEVSAVAPYLRITPVHTRDTVLNLDLWYGLSASGKEKIPVRVFGLDGHLHTEPTKAGGMMGGAAQLTHRVSRNIALFTSYLWRTARQDGGKARISGDFLGLYEPVQVPDLKLTNHALLIGVSLVN